MGDTGEEAERLFTEAVLARAKSRGLSKKELAAAAGIHRSHVYRASGGQRGLSLAAAVRMSSAVGTRVGELLGETAAPAEDSRLPRLAQGLEDLATAVRLLRGVLHTESVTDGHASGGARSHIPTLEEISSPPDARPPVTPWEARQKLRRPTTATPGFEGMDQPRPVYDTEADVFELVAAGPERELEILSTGEKAMVPNPTFRQAQRAGWRLLKVVGDSMEKLYFDGDFVYVSPAPKTRLLEDGDIVVAWHGDKALLKVLRFKSRDKTDPDRLKGVRLESLNKKYKPVTVTPGDENFRILGIAETGIIGKRRFGRRRTKNA